MFDKLTEYGMLQQLTDRGIISKKMHEYFKYYREVQFMHINCTLNTAVLKVAVKFKVDERTIWRALKVIRS